MSSRTLNIERDGMFRLLVLHLPAWYCILCKVNRIFGLSRRCYIVLFYSFVLPQGHLLHLVYILSMGLVRLASWCIRRTGVNLFKP
jgi:hypothetical protein